MTTHKIISTRGASDPKYHFHFENRKKTTFTFVNGIAF